MPTTTDPVTAVTSGGTITVPPNVFNDLPVLYRKILLARISAQPLTNPLRMHQGSDGRFHTTITCQGDLTEPVEVNLLETGWETRRCLDCARYKSLDQDGYVPEALEILNLEDDLEHLTSSDPVAPSTLYRILRDVNDLSETNDREWDELLGARRGRSHPAPAGVTDGSWRGTATAPRSS